VVLPELLDRIGARKPILVGHSDGASIALIHAGNRTVGGVVLLAPHVFVEEITLAAIRETRERYRTGDLRERMVRHHDDPDATFSGWCDVWLDPAFRTWTIESEAEGITAPVQLIQGSDDPYGSLDQTDRIEARVRRPVERVVLPGGHSAHLEHSDAVVAAVAGFVQRLG
jgi:pimeloyl-ACP methyl ester carboxylesterase